MTTSPGTAVGRKEICWCADGVTDPYVIFDMTDQVVRFKRGTDFCMLLVSGGVFPSITQARKAGFKGDIPAGYSDFKCNGFRIFIWNPNDPDFYRSVEDGYDESLILSLT